MHPNQFSYQVLYGAQVKYISEKARVNYDTREVKDMKVGRIG